MKDRFCCRVVVLLILMTCVVRVVYADESERVERAAQPLMSTTMTPKQARAELQRMIDESIFVASQQLNEIGTFYPYGAVMEPNGEIKLVGVAASEKDKPPPAKTLAALKRSLSALAKKKRYRAVAIFVDFVATRKDTAARQAGIRIELEHRQADKLSVFLPYLISENRPVRLLTPQTMPGTLSILNKSQ